MPGEELASPYAPTARVVPSAESATAEPNASLASVLDALIYASWAKLARGSPGSGAASALVVAPASGAIGDSDEVHEAQSATVHAKAGRSHEPPLAPRSRTVVAAPLVCDVTRSL